MLRDSYSGHVSDASKVKQYIKDTTVFQDHQRDVTSHLVWLSLKNYEKRERVDD